MRWGIRQRMQSGPFKFRDNLLGYRKGEDGEPEIVEEEAKYIRAIFNMYLDGKSLDQIKSYLEGEGVLTKTGKNVWNKCIIQAILTNERYCGDLLMKKTFTENCITKKSKEKPWRNAEVPDKGQSPGDHYSRDVQNGADGNGSARKR